MTSGKSNPKARQSKPNSSASASASTSVSPPPQTLNASGQPRKRRLNLACVECKARKIRCDRNVPQCQSCVRRGIAHKCRWGDERDEANTSAPLSNDATTSALLARVYQKEQRIKKLEAKLKAAGISYESKGDFQGLEEEDELEQEAEDGEDEEKTAMKEINSPDHHHPVWFGPDPSNKGKGKAPERSITMFSTPQDKSCDPTSLPQRLSSFLSLLPKPEGVIQAVSVYLEEMERWVSCIHAPTLHAQVEGILSSLDWFMDGSVALKPGARIKYDEVALVFSILSSLSCEKTLLIIPKSAEDFTAYHEASLEFLHYSRFWDSPTLAGLQCLIVMRYYTLTNNSVNFSRGLTAGAIRMAEVMNLHRLGSYESDEQRWRSERESGKKRKFGQTLEPEMDINSQETAFYLPVQAENRVRERSLKLGEGSHVMRETGRRIWWSLKIQDEFQGLLSSNPGRFEFRELNATAFPLNIDDNDLVDNVYPLKVQPYQVPTIAAYLERIDKLNSCIRDAVEASGQSTGYESVLEIDSKIRKLLDELPDVLSYGKNGETEEARKLREARPYLKYHRESIQHWCHEYMLSIHRSYASRGYLEPMYQPSLQTSISSARMIIAILRDPSDQSQKGASLSILCNLFFVLSALLTHLLHKSTNAQSQDGYDNMKAQEIEDIKADVDFGIQSMKAFFYPQGTPEQQRRTERAISILTVLRKKVDSGNSNVEIDNDSTHQEHKRRHTLPSPISIEPNFNQQQPHHRLSSGSEIPQFGSDPARPQLSIVVTPPSTLSLSDQQKLDKDLDEFVSGLLQQQNQGDQQVQPQPQAQAQAQIQSQVPIPPPSPSFPILPNLDELLWTPTDPSTNPSNCPNRYSAMNPTPAFIDNSSASHLNFSSSSIPRSHHYQYPQLQGPSQFGYPSSSMSSSQSLFSQNNSHLGFNHNPF